MRYARRSRSFGLPFVPLFLVIAAIGAACGSGGDGAAEPATPAPSATAAPSPTPEPTRIGGSMILATTTSTQDSGLLDELVPMFREQTGIDVKVIAVGTGAALEMGAKGDADSVLTHAPASERKYVDSSDLVEGTLVMHNDFVILGPEADPAGVDGSASLKDAMAAIAASGPFVSRGDDSGTHKAELTLWTAAGIDPATVARREETGQGMGATLNIADQKSAYVLADRGTYLALRDDLDLVVVFEGDRALLNIYHAYLVNPVKHRAVKAAQARAWIAFLVSPDVQKFIGEFKKAEFGESLFIPDAGKNPATLAD
ncbi:MAG TPA: substrate-binding domain-containing protein [Tepidiformaceae bacterium]|nr:substrate-binding domain-containing protein [Tepidiformaceae bacterium]